MRIYTLNNTDNNNRLVDFEGHTYVEDVPRSLQTKLRISRNLVISFGKEVTLSNGFKISNPNRVKKIIKILVGYQKSHCFR